MKKHLYAMAAVAATGAFAAGPALAQSNITIYGSLDAGVAWIDNLNGSSTSRLDQGTMQPDRFGFRGTEDLGNGLKAVFQLEGGFGTDTGNMVSANRLFNRLSIVGLSGSFGTVTLGNMPDIVFDYAGKLSNGFQLTNFYLFHPGNLDTLANTYQFNNSVRYTSPTVNGLAFSAMVGAGEQPERSSRNRNTSAGATYTNGALRMALAYSRQNDRAAGYSGAFLSSLNLGNAATVFDRLTTWAGGAGYTVGDWRLNALYTQSTVDLPSTSFRQRNLDLGAAWRYGARSTVNLGYTRSQVSGSLDDAKYDQASASHVVALSKRTEFYVQAAYQKAGGSASFAFQNYAGASGDDSQVVTTIGVHHLF
ncbi:porin [Pseudoduganella umbonata]|uniref:Porin n=1 Tax=Pseudoduganella umbonata TaxID=864828 RepID=A0A4P8HMY6_9BURK|nr:porin [Pseudoduganella umbonata]MBB3219588.1 putative porin [Pseudoduganella umbonata]QCP09655.1 porin [Pseudoduganella umbonata]